MTKNKKEYKWDPPEWLDSPRPETIVVHDTQIDVYSGFVLIEGIKLYRENNRTTLDLQHLLEKLGLTQIVDLTDEQIIDYILKQSLHKIQELAGSIEKNGVKVPLILTYKKELIDGNRRFLACKYLFKTEPSDEKFTKIPVRCLPPHIDKDLRLKIISQENFLPDYKEPWPREVRAKFAVDRYDEFLKEYKDEDKAYQQIKYFLEISKQELQTFKAVLGMIEEFVKYVKNYAAKNKQDAEKFARSKFHFFEEFYNKTQKGRNPIKDRTLLRTGNDLLYKYILDEQISSTMRVRELSEIIRYEPTLKYLQKPQASFEIARSNYQDYARPKKAALKIGHFCEWLENLTDEEKKEITKALKERLIRAMELLK
jgi:hypothetical protein